MGLLPPVQDEVVRLDLELWGLGDGRHGQLGAWLSLGTRGHDEDLAGVEVLHLLGCDHVLVTYVYDQMVRIKPMVTRRIWLGSKSFICWGAIMSCEYTCVGKL